MSKATTQAAESKETTALEAPETAAPEAPEFYVAPGKAITSLKGILSGENADEIKPEYLAGGKDAFEALRKSKHILRS